MSGEGGENPGLQAVFPTVSQNSGWGKPTAWNLADLSPRHSPSADSTTFSFLQPEICLCARQRENPTAVACSGLHPCTPSPLLLHLTQNDPVGLLRGLPNDADGREPHLGEHHPDGGPGGCKGTQSSSEIISHQGHHLSSEHHLTSEASQVFCSPCTELRPTLCLSNTGWKYPCMCIIYITSVYKNTFCPGLKASNSLRHQSAQTSAPTVVFYCTRSSELCRIFLTAASPLVELRTHCEARHQAAFTESYKA